MSSIYLYGVTTSLMKGYVADLPGTKNSAGDPCRFARIFVIQIDGKWLASACHVLDRAYGPDAKVLLCAHTITTQRREEKVYASLDTLYVDFKRMLGPCSSMTLDFDG